MINIETLQTLHNEHAELCKQEPHDLSYFEGKNGDHILLAEDEHVKVVSVEDSNIFELCKPNDFDKPSFDELIEQAKVEGFVNYGDVNPFEHGGLFIKQLDDGQVFCVSLSVSCDDVPPIYNVESCLMDPDCFEGDDWESACSSAGIDPLTASTMTAMGKAQLMIGNWGIESSSNQQVWIAPVEELEVEPAIWLAHVEQVSSVGMFNYNSLRLGTMPEIVNLVKAELAMYGEG